MNILELHAVTKCYAESPAAPVNPVLRGITLSLAEGETIAVMGPSGSGKSTLLNIIGTLEQTTSGTVRIAGRPVAALPETDLARIRNRIIGFVFQLHHLLPQCTVLENILLPTLVPPHDKPSRHWLERAGQLMDRAGILALRDQTPPRLSGGERQRVAVVRALIRRPQLLLADEPTGSLDRETAHALLDLLLEVNRAEQVAIVLVTHSAALAGAMQRKFDLRHGKLEPVE